jgi:hypothetical protein
MRVSSSVSSLGECAESKIAPQISSAFQETFGAAKQIIKIMQRDRHGLSLASTQRQPQ